MNGLLKKYWYLLVLLFVLPIGLNFLLQANAPFKVIGDSSIWLLFWSTYLASILGSLITLYVLLKTLEQNEVNNNASKELQISIYKKGLEERRIQELSIILKDSLRFINYTKFHRNYNSVISKEYETASSFFDVEITRCLDRFSLISLDFISSDKDKIEEEYQTLFKNVLNKYTNLISVIIRVIAIMEKDGLKSKIDTFKKKHQGKENGLFTIQEYNKLTLAPEEFLFDEYIKQILGERFEKFCEIYGEEHPKLIRESKELISHKKEQLEKIHI